MAAPNMADPQERADLMAQVRAITDASYKLSVVLDVAEKLPADVQEYLIEAATSLSQFVEDGRCIVTALRNEEQRLRQYFIDDGRDGSSGQIVDPVDARRRRAASRGWKPSRHPELDAEFFNRTRPWPNGDRLHIKRFNDNGDHEMASIVLKVEYANNSGRIFELTRPPGRRDRRETERSMVTAEELLADCWEVD